MVMIPPKKLPFPKKGISLKKTKFSKEKSFFTQNQMLFSEIFKKLREKCLFSSNQRAIPPFLPTYAA